MTGSTQFSASLIRRLPSGGACLVIVVACAALLAPIQPTRAQNLVSNPSFTDGLSGFTTTGNVGVYSLSDGTTTAGILGPGENGPKLAGTVFTSPSNLVGMLTQAITTTPNTLYMITFSAYADPNVEDLLAASFGDYTLSKDIPATQVNGGDVNGGTGPLSSNLKTITFTALSTGATTDLGFTANQGGFLVTDIDVQSAPVPVTGGGIASFCVALVGLAVHRMRRKGHPIVSA